MGRTKHSLGTLFLAGITLSSSVACSRAPRPATAAAASEAPVAPAIDATPPPDLAPSTMRDRRDAPGVRSAPKRLVLGKAKDAKCGKLPGIGGETAKHELLAGRLQIELPKAARAVEAPAGGPAAEEESRVVLEGGGLGMAVMAKETFQLDPDLYEPEADAPARPGSLDVEAPKFLKAVFSSEEGLEIVPVTVSADPAKLRVYAARPRRPSSPPGGDTALVLALLVAHPDGALETVTFHVRGEQVRSATGTALVGCTRLAERMASTLVKGPREMDRQAGIRRVASASPDEDLIVRVPRDYVTVPAASGVRLYKLRPLSLYAGNIAVSVGDRAENAEGGATVAGKLLGKETQWRGQINPKGGGFLFATAPLEPGAAPQERAKFVNVLVKAVRQTKILDEMRGVAETLAVVPRSALPPAAR